MIYIKELFTNCDIVEIRVDGILDYQSIPILKNVSEVHLNSGKKVSLNLGGLNYVSREGMEFLQEIKKKVIIENIPQFLKLEP